jgi:ribose 5-phosphate isomerase B
VDRGILICGTGMGMCIVANKFPGVRAANCHDDLTAENSRLHNDANVLCLSADLLGERLVNRMIEIWLKTEFEGGRHAQRVQKISQFESRNGHVDPSTISPPLSPPSPSEAAQ